MAKEWGRQLATSHPTPVRNWTPGKPKHGSTNSEFKRSATRGSSGPELKFKVLSNSPSSGYIRAAAKSGLVIEDVGCG